MGWGSSPGGDICLDSCSVFRISHIRIPGTPINPLRGITEVMIGDNGPSEELGSLSCGSGKVPIKS